MFFAGRLVGHGHLRTSSFITSSGSCISSVFLAPAKVSTEKTAMSNIHLDPTRVMKNYCKHQCKHVMTLVAPLVKGSINRFSPASRCKLRTNRSNRCC